MGQAALSLDPETAQVILAALDEVERRAPQLPRLELHKAQAGIVKSAKRFNVICCGRRWGKTIMGLDLTVPVLLDGYPAGWFSPSYKYLVEVWRDALELFSPLITRQSIQEKRIELETGGVLEFWSLEDQEAGRSRKYKRVVIDEAAMAAYLRQAWEFSIRPTLTDYKGDAWFLSTPAGRNYFYSLYRKEDYDPDWKSWQKPTATNTCIPGLDEEIAAAKRELPADVFRQEYEAQFLENAGSVFRNLAACIVPKRDNPIPYAATSYVMGIDWGQKKDWTAAIVMDAETRQVCAIDRFNKIEYEFQRDRIGALAGRWGCEYILAESNAMGQPIIESLQSDGLPVIGYHTDARGKRKKERIIQQLAVGFEQENIGIIDDRVLLGELEAYEGKRTMTGWSYAAPEGEHDDTVMALALAYEAALIGNRWSVAWA
jgi:hypothetical protein